MPWKRDWSKQACRHDWLFIYRDAIFGRALHEVKFRWIPAAKHLLHKMSGRECKPDAKRQRDSAQLQDRAQPSIKQRRNNGKAS
jgi:hypothetical protein